MGQLTSVSLEISRYDGGRVPIRRNETHLGCMSNNNLNTSHPISIPSTLTAIRMGNGEIPVALVISGTAVRPFSDEVWVSMTWRALVRVVARVALNS